MKFKRIALILAIVLCIIPFASCSARDASTTIINNVSQRKINKNPHVAEWIERSSGTGFDGISNFILEYSNKNTEIKETMGDTRYTYKLVILRENVEKQAKIRVEYVEEDAKVTVKIIFTDTNKDAKDGRTVSYVEVKIPFNKMVYYDIICEGESRELLERTDKNINM